MSAFLPEEAPADPWELLTQWLPDNEEPTRPLMTVATVDESGMPDARTLLLSRFDREGFAFHTDSRSRKAAQLAARPAVALTIVWPSDPKQLVVQGMAEVSSTDEQEWVYAHRSPYLRELAWLNTDAFQALPIDERRRQWARFAEEHPDPQPPPTWIGFVVRPQRITFWSSNPDTASRRAEYRLEDGSWTVSYLAG